MGTIIEEMEKRREERRRRAGEEVSAMESKLGLDVTPNKSYDNAAATAMAQIDDDELDDDAKGILATMMKGRLASTTPMQSFENFFGERNQRPALTALQDGIRAMLAGRTGQKFVSVRDQAFGEYTELQKLRQTQQQLDQQKMSQLMTTARSLVNAQKSAEVRQLGFMIQQSKTEAERVKFTQMLMFKIGALSKEDLQKEGALDLKTQQFKQKIMQDERFKNPTADSAKDLALIQIRATDPEFPEDLKTLNPQQAKIFGEEFNKAYKSLLPPKSASSAVSWRIIQRETGYGDQELIAINPKNPAEGFTVDSGGPILTAGKLSEDEKKSAQAARSYFTNAKIVVHSIMNNPESISKQRLIPEKALQLLGLETFDARQVERGFKQMVLQAQRAITGAQATDAERKYIEALFPETYGADPALVVNDLGYAALVGMATAIRTEAHLKGKLDLTEVLTDVYDDFKEATKIGKAVPWDASDVDKIIEEAARRQGKEVLRDSFGRIRDIK